MSCQAIKQSAAEDIFPTAETVVPPMPGKLAKQTAQRLRNAVDMGNISELKTIAEALRSGSDAYGSFCDSIARLTEDFDFDGILKLCGELEAQSE